MPHRELQKAMRRTWEQNKDLALGDPKRLTALYSSRFYTAPQRTKLREFCQLACNLLDTPQSYITLLTDTEVVMLVGIPEARIPALAETSYCQYVVGENGPFVVCNSVEEDLRDHPATVNGIRSYLGVPLVGQDDMALGSFCVADVIPRVWKESDVIMLVQLSAAIVAFHEEDAA